MKKVLLNEFKKYENMKKEDENIDFGNFSPTVILPLIYNRNLNFEGVDSIKKVNIANDNSENISNEIINELTLDKKNITVLKFIFHELIGNIYDHSKCENAYVMGKLDGNYYEFSFLDDGMTIPGSLGKLDYPIKNDCDAIIQAVMDYQVKMN